MRQNAEPCNCGIYEDLGGPFMKNFELIFSDAVDHLGPLLLTWFNFNPSMDK